MTSTTRTLPACDDLERPSQGAGLGGLLALIEGQERPLPLRLVRVRTRIAGPWARTEVEQCFANPLAVPVEAVHIFPLPHGAAVVDARLIAGEVTVRAECRERREAEAEFARARAEHHRAMLLTQERADVHTLRVTNLPPGGEVRVQLTLVERLDVTDGRYRWRFPTVLAPRYVPGEAVGHEGPGSVPDTDRVPDASRLQPPIRLRGGTTLDLEALILPPVTAVRSSLHACEMQLESGAVRIAPAQSATLDRDFVLEIARGADTAAAASAWTDGEYTLVTVEPPVRSKAPAVPRDAVFVIDVSGSMQGAKLAAAKRAVIAALHGLVAGDRFRLLAFNEEVTAPSDGLLDYDDRSLASGDRFVAGLEARGGTELKPAIEQALAGEQPAGRLRTVLLITDGQVQNDTELLQAIAARRGRSLLFVVGIDSAPHVALLERLARFGGGTCEVCAPADDIEAVIARVEARFGTPLVAELALDGELAAPRAQALFAGRSASALLRGAPSEVVVSGRGSDGRFEVRARPERADFPLGMLWARERVQFLEDELCCAPERGNALERDITALALQHGIASRFTAFVAVESRTRVDGTPIEIVQPVELPHSWELPDLAMPLGAPRQAPMASAVALAVDPSVLDALARPRPSGLAALASRLLGSRGTGGRPSAPVPPSAPAASEAGDLAGALARAQAADGSFGRDAARTAAALIALVLLGHTRLRGLRKRTVEKAAAWLASRGKDPRARLALDVLERAERGEPVTPQDEWRTLAPDSAEGEALTRAMRGR